MNLIFINEFEISEKISVGISHLLASAFPYADYKGRSFFKQMPQYRLILFNEESEVIGQLAVDYRAMNLGNELIKVWGIVDFAIEIKHQKKGYGTMMMHEFIRLAEENSQNIDFLYLVTDLPEFYKKFGFEQASLEKIKWLKIHDLRTLGLGYEKVDDCLQMYKPISGKAWTGDELDMLGYWY